MSTPALDRRVTPDLLFAGLAEVLPPLLDDEFNGRRDICIVATRLCKIAGRYFGIDIRPVATTVVAANRAFVQWVEENGRYPTIDELNALGDALGIHSVGCDGITAPQGKLGWPFHLIGVAGGLAIDASAGQFERVHREILPPRVLIFPFDATRRIVHTMLSDGGIVMYQSAWPERGYVSAPDWKYNAPRLAGPLIRRLSKVIV